MRKIQYPQDSTTEQTFKIQDLQDLKNKIMLKVVEDLQDLATKCQQCDPQDLIARHAKCKMQFHENSTLPRKCNTEHILSAW